MLMVAAATPALIAACGGDVVVVGSGESASGVGGATASVAEATSTGTSASSSGCTSEPGGCTDAASGGSSGASGGGGSCLHCAEVTLGGGVAQLCASSLAIYEAALQCLCNGQYCGKFPRCQPFCTGMSDKGCNACILKTTTDVCKAEFDQCAADE
jgi:hypothetical protein